MKKVLITGASQGLGRAMALQLAQAGHGLILCSRSLEKLTKVKDEIYSLNPKAVVMLIDVDLSNSNEVNERLKSLAQSDYPNVLINNLGIYKNDTIETLNVQGIDAQLNLNLFTAVQLTNFFLKQLKIQKGHVINIGSIVSQRPSTEAVSYSISKHALKAWNDCLREDLRSFEVKVTAIYPGAMNTSSWDQVENIDRSQMIQAEDIAKLVTDILSFQSSTLVEEIHLSPLNFN